MFESMGRFNFLLKQPMLDRTDEGFSKVNVRHLLLSGEIDREYK
jgi:hypothetical protein